MRRPAHPRHIVVTLILSLALAGCAGGSQGTQTTDGITSEEQQATTSTASSDEGRPDYADESMWAYFGIGEGKDADLFIIAPTVDTQDEYAMSLDDEDTKEKFVGALNMERGIYEDSARLYAPYYRQAAMKVYDLTESERKQYLDLAFEDVAAAFEYYLSHENDGRPIVLAGFSQGADMCYRLLETYFDDEALRDRLVAVYAIGWPYTQEMVDAYPQIVPATHESDVGVVVSFECEAPEVNDTFIVPAGVHALSINPLNWRTDATPADASQNLGACFTNYSGSIVSEVSALCGCYIDEDRGTLKVTGISADDYPPRIDLLPDGSYHIYDYQFFYRNLQQNVSTRVDAWVGAHAADMAA